MTSLIMLMTIYSLVCNYDFPLPKHLVNNEGRSGFTYFKSSGDISIATKKVITLTHMRDEENSLGMSLFSFSQSKSIPLLLITQNQATLTP